MLTKERILVTGSEGTIGKVLRSSLGGTYDVIGVDKDETGNKPNLYITNITDLESLREVFRATAPLSAVIHLAANPDENADWKDILNNNIVGTRNVYSCMREFGVRRSVLASSTHTVGKYEGYPQSSPLGRPIGVEDPLRPDSYYGVSKGFGEMLARTYYDLYGIETICIRIGHVTKDNQPAPPYEKLWLSYRDASQVFLKALQASMPFGIYFATSNNRGMIFMYNLL